MTSVNARPGPDRQLSREDVLDKALAIVDRDGLAALNARRLGAELGVGSATPYRYFQTRDRLIDAMIGHAFPSPAEPAAGDRDWQTSLAGAIRGVRENLVRHPGVLEIVMTRPAGDPALDPWRDRIFGILRAAGLSPRVSVEAGVALIGFVFGSVIMEGFRAHKTPAEERERIESLEPADLPALTDIAAAYARYHSSPRSFEFALEQLIAAYAATLRSDDG